MLQMLGLDDKRILTSGYCTDGKVTEVKTCHWLKVNTNPIRRSHLDGAKFPHIIHFTYGVNNAQYHGSLFVNWNRPCPVKDESITVYYDSKKPAKYAVLI